MFKPVAALAAACLGILLSGCLPSAIPIAKNNETTVDGLAGTWTGKDIEYVVRLKPDGSCYEVDGRRLSEKNDSLPSPGPYKLFAFRQGDALYATCVLDFNRLEEVFKDKEKNKAFEELASRLAFNVAPIFWTFKLDLQGDALKLLTCDANEKLPNLMKADDIEISHASSEALRAWLAENGATAFKENEAFVFARKAAPAK